MMRGLRGSAGLLWVTVVAAAILQCMAVPQATPAQEAQTEDAAIIKHLNAAITWYKQLTSANESAGQPSDTYYLENARSLAKQAVELAFQSAEAEATLLSSGKGTEGPSSEQQNLTKAAADSEALSKQTQAQIELLNSKIPQASGKRLQFLISQRDALQGQLDFDKALLEGIEKLRVFASGNARNAGGLSKEIDELKTSVPDLFAKAPSKGAPSAPFQFPRQSDTGGRSDQSGSKFVVEFWGPAGN